MQTIHINMENIATMTNKIIVKKAEHKYIIRLASVRDLPSLKNLGREFVKEGNIPTAFIPEVFEATWGNFFNLGMGVIFLLILDEEIIGALGAVKYPDPNSGEIMAAEHFWFVNKEHRGKGTKLLKAYELWAKDQNIKKITMVHLTGLMPDKLRKLYVKLGYREIETHYIKEVR